MGMRPQRTRWGARRCSFPRTRPKRRDRLHSGMEPLAPSIHMATHPRTWAGPPGGFRVRAMKETLVSTPGSQKPAFTDPSELPGLSVVAGPGSGSPFSVPTHCGPCSQGDSVAGVRTGPGASGAPGSQLPHFTPSSVSRPTAGGHDDSTPLAGLAGGPRVAACPRKDAAGHSASPPVASSFCLVSRAEKHAAHSE